MLRLSLSLCLGLASLALLVASGSGQDAKKETKIKGMLPQGWKALKLMDAQKQKVYGIQAEYRHKIEKLEEQIKELKAQEKMEMFKVLTEEQKAALRKSLLGEGGKEKGSPKEEKK